MQSVVTRKVRSPAQAATVGASPSQVPHNHTVLVSRLIVPSNVAELEVVRMLSNFRSV